VVSVASESTVGPEGQPPRHAAAIDLYRQLPRNCPLRLGVNVRVKGDPAEGGPGWSSARVRMPPASPRRAPLGSYSSRCSRPAPLPDLSQARGAAAKASVPPRLIGRPHVFIEGDTTFSGWSSAAPPPNAARYLGTLQSPRLPLPVAAASERCAPWTPTTFMRSAIDHEITSRDATK
jgi:hypothetical protein